MKWPKIKCLVILLTAFSSTQLQAQEWLFTAYLDNKEMGYHNFTLTEQGAEKTLNSQASFKVKLLFINAYSYEHTAEEKWNKDCLQSLQATTVENRESTAVSAKLEGDSLVVQGTKGKQSLGKQSLSGCAMTFAYWNPTILKQSKLLNPQTGEWLDVSIKRLGKENINVRGVQTATEHYQIVAKKMNIELWYTLEQDWVALKSTTPEGYVVTYQRK